VVESASKRRDDTSDDTPERHVRIGDSKKAVRRSKRVKFCSDKPGGGLHQSNRIGTRL
jgi:hypothetical protein